MIHFNKLKITYESPKPELCAADVISVEAGDHEWDEELLLKIPNSEVVLRHFKTLLDICWHLQLTSFMVTRDDFSVLPQQERLRHEMKREGAHSGRNRRVEREPSSFCAGEVGKQAIL